MKNKKQNRDGVRLTQAALKAINKPSVRRELMDKMGVTEFTIARYIQQNNSNLTRYAAMEVIRRITGLPDDQIIESSEPEKK